MFIYFGLKHKCDALITNMFTTDIRMHWRIKRKPHESVVSE